MGDVLDNRTAPAAPCPKAAALPSPDEMLGRALAAIGGGKRALAATLEALPAPVYVTDADGWVTGFNRACVEFAGRTPAAGRDRWCVSWRLYEESGASIAHDHCPMAVAIRERRPIRGVTTVAERPDGSRVTFVPYPTPVLDEAGRLVGAVNLLVELTDARQAEALRAQARRCRRLAASVSDKPTVEILAQMAEEYDRKANRLLAC